MLRRAESASVTFRARFVSKRGHVDFYVGSKGVHDRTDGASNRAQAVKRKRLRAGQFRSIPLPQYLDLMESRSG